MTQTLITPPQTDAPTVRFAVLDIETTGLRTATDVILEVGAILLDKNLKEIARFSQLVNDDVTLCKMNELRRRATSGDANAKFVWEMHVNSGLWHDMVTTPDIYTLADVQQGLEDFFVDNGFADVGTNKSAVTLAGSSIHFDMEFLTAYMPEVIEFFHYRRLDVSGFKVAIDSWQPVLKEKRDAELSKDKAHRVLADCEASIAELRWYLDNAIWHVGSKNA